MNLLRTPDVAVPFLCSFLGSLPISMLGLGVLLLVQSVTGSFAQAGLVSGTLTAGNAIGLIIQGRLIDRRGQRVVLAVSGPTCGLWLLGFTVAIDQGPQLQVMVTFAALAGASIPAVITSMRVLVPHLVGASLRQTAYALLATEFQLAMITGPLVVSGLLVLATLLVAGFAGGLAGGLVTVAVPVVAVAHGIASVSGLLFAAQSTGDLVGGLAYGSKKWLLPVPSRLLRFQLAGALAVSLLAPTSGVPVAMLLTMALHGAMQAPAGIASTTLLDDVVREDMLGQSYLAARLVAL